MMIAAVAGAGTLAFAGDELTSLSYISYLERYATVYPASGDETLDVQVNMPILAGDRLDTARGARVEVQLADGCIVWVDEFTTVDFDALALSRDTSSRRTVLHVVAGTIAVEVPATATVDENLRIDSGRASVFLSRPGLFRLTAKRGELHVEAHAGLAELPARMGSALLRAGQQAWIEEDDDENDIERARLDVDPDDFWSWVEERRNPRGGGQTARYVEGHHGYRAAVLDTYGEWVYVSAYSSWAWRPRVSVTWRPYSLGRWYWTPVGWTWISYEPWGWYPYHYGSWYWDAGYGWVWCWDWVWGPAWVHWMWADGYVGWCPRGYYDWWYWRHHHHHYQGRWPDRWSHAAFDFSGRVRLREIDPRPWTFVPGDRFGSSHIDRVRLDSERVLREIGERGEGIVRSGPLVTRTPARELPDRGVGDALRRSAGDRPLPDLGALLRRDAEDLTRNAGERAILQPSRTEEFVSRTLPSRGVELPGREPGNVTRQRGDGGGRVRVGPGSTTGPRTGREAPGRTIPSREIPSAVPGSSGQPEAGGTTTERSVQRPDGGSGRVPPSERPGARTDRGSAPGSRGSGRSEPAGRPDPGASRPDPPARSDPPPRSDPPARADPPARPDPPSRPDPPVRERTQATQRSYEMPDRTAYRVRDGARPSSQDRDNVSFRARTQPGPENSRTAGRSPVTSSGQDRSRAGSIPRQGVPAAPRWSDGSTTAPSWSGGSRTAGRSEASGGSRSAPPSSPSRSWASPSGGWPSAGRSTSGTGGTGSRSSAGAPSSRSSAGSSSSSSSSSSGSSNSRSSSGSSNSSGPSRGSGSSRHR